MRADHRQSHRTHVRPRLGIARGTRRGIALMWALIGIVIISLLSAAAMHLVRGEQLVNDNFDSGRRALYLADQALSQFYADFRPTTSLKVPVVSTVSDTTMADEADTASDPDAITDVNGTFDGADLKSSNLLFETGNAIITPYKIVESQFGDVYLLESSAGVYDSRGDRPDAIRTLRTYASLVPPFRLRGALSAPAGVTAPSGGKDGKSCPSGGKCDHFHLDGGKKGKCGTGTSVPPLATPATAVLTLGSAKVHLKNGLSGLQTDSSTDDYAEMMDSLHVDFASISQDSYFSGMTNFIDIPRDAASLAAINWSLYPTAALWPIILVHGNTTVTTAVKGHGMLIVDGDLTISANKLDWQGVILVGKQLSVTGSAHLHEHGTVAAGLNCSNGEANSGRCAVYFTGSHIGIAYAQCDAETAWAQMLVLRPLTPSRHTRLY